MIDQKAIKRAQDALLNWALLNSYKPEVAIHRKDNYIYFAPDVDIPPHIQELLDSLLHSAAKKNPDGSWEITIQGERNEN